MQKKLTEEKQREILDAGVQAFSEKGLEKTTMNDIAHRAGISVGVLYKYYKDKGDFFRACVYCVVEEMRQFLEEITRERTKPLLQAKALITKSRRLAEEKRPYFRLYLEMARNQSLPRELIHDIEGYPARIYTDAIRDAQQRGDMRRDLDPALLAMCFDDLLKMLQFSYASPYFEERAQVYGGEHALEEDWLTEGMLRFMESAFTLESGDIRHREETPADAPADCKREA